MHVITDFRIFYSSLQISVCSTNIIEMEEAILELELLKLEKEKAENSTMNLSKRREPILKQFIASIRKNAELERDNPLLLEIVSLKAKIEELTEKNQRDMKHNVCLAQNVQNLLKKQKEIQKALDDKTKELGGFQFLDLIIKELKSHMTC